MLTVVTVHLVPLIVLQLLSHRTVFICVVKLRTLPVTAVLRQHADNQNTVHGPRRLFLGASQLQNSFFLLRLSVLTK